MISSKVASYLNRQSTAMESQISGFECLLKLEFSCLIVLFAFSSHFLLWFHLYLLLKGILYENFNSLLERAFKIVKNGLCFIVIALLVAIGVIQHFDLCKLGRLLTSQCGHELMLNL